MYPALPVMLKKVREAEEDNHLDEPEEDSRWWWKECCLCGKAFCSALPPGQGRLICHSPACIIEYEAAEIVMIASGRKKPPRPRAARAKFLAVGYVYLMGSDVGLYKIGRTRDLNGRVGDLNRQYPVKIWLIHPVASHSYKRLERWLHKKFADKRQGLEWFALSQEDVDWFTSKKDFDLDTLFSE